MPTVLSNVRFSNRPFGVKRFQTIRHCSVDVARGLVLLFGIGTRALPSWDSKTRRNNLLVGLAVNQTAGPSGQHNALDALVVGITSRRVNFIFDADVASFFDSVSKGWLVRFVEHRIGDVRIIRLIQKWLKAGVLENGVVTVSEKGTGQGQRLLRLSCRADQRLCTESILLLCEAHLVAHAAAA